MPKSKHRLINKKFIFFVCIFCNACTVDIKDEKDYAPTNIPVDVMAVPDAVPRYEKRTRAGNPVKYEVLGKQYKVLTVSKGYQERGMASWYGAKFHGRKTSNGEVYDMYAMTAAHKTLPIPSYVRVTNLKNQRSVVVRINDRGPFHENRIIDLSYTAAVKLGIQKMGTGFVEVSALDAEEPGKMEQKNIQPLQRQRVSEVFLQFGSFASLANARQLQLTLPASEPLFRSSVLPVQSKTGTLYKVQLGPFSSTDQFNEASEKLWHIGITDVMFVNTITRFDAPP